MKTLLSAFIAINIGLFHVCNAQIIRKDYNEMTSNEREAYVDAIYQLHDGIITDMADYHNDNFGLLHFNIPINNSNNDNDVFLAWHRMAILEMEEAIQGIYPELCIPYWNWITDNSDSDPLWEQHFLGQFDDPQAYEDLNRDLSGNLPDQTDVDNVQGISNWIEYTNTLERGIVHTGGHVWVDGVMNQGNSPLDPVFYMHHGMIDKLWQEWEENFSATSYVVTSIPRYPNTDPNDIVDSRDLKVWYAEDGEVLLDQYDTDGTEEYKYTGIINAEDDFVVKNGSDVTFIAGDAIVLGANFKAETGASFYAEVDTDVGDILAKTRGDITEEPFEESTDMPEAFSLSQNYPNPFNPVTVIRYQLPVSSDVQLQVFDLLGRTVTTLVDGQVSAGEHEVRFDASNLSSGVYIYRIRANDFVETRQMTLIK